MITASHTQISEILKTLPIGLYLGDRTPVVYEESGDSYANLMDGTIHVSGETVMLGLAHLPADTDPYEFENAIRAILYHELSHIIMTPKTLKNDSEHIINIFEDERIETLLSKYYLGVNFKKMCLALNGWTKDWKPTDARTYFYGIVRFRQGPAEFVERVAELIHKWKSLRADANGYSVEDYRDDIMRFWNEVRYDWDQNRKQRQDEQKQRNQERNQKEQDKQNQQGQQGQQGQSGKGGSQKDKGDQKQGGGKQSGDKQEQDKDGKNANGGKDGKDKQNESSDKDQDKGGSNGGADEKQDNGESGNGSQSEDAGKDNGGKDKKNESSAGNDKKNGGSGKDGDEKKDGEDSGNGSDGGSDGDEQDGQNNGGGQDGEDGEDDSSDGCDSGEGDDGDSEGEDGQDGGNETENGKPARGKRSGSRNGGTAKEQNGRSGLDDSADEDAESDGASGSEKEEDFDAKEIGESVEQGNGKDIDGITRESIALDVKRILGKFHDEKVGRVLERLIIQHNKKRMLRTPMSRGYTGKVGYKDVAIRHDYRWFTRKGGGGENMYGSTHFTLWVDCSGSFYDEIGRINSVIHELNKLARRIGREFSFDVVQMTMKNKVVPTTVELGSGGCNGFGPGVEECIRKTRKTGCNNYNVVVWDGDMFSGFGRNERERYLPVLRKAFNNQNTVIVTDGENERYTRTNTPNARVKVIHDSYSTHFVDALLELLAQVLV